MKKVIKWIIIVFVVLFVGSAAIAGIIEGIKGEDAVKESSNKGETVKKEKEKEEEEKEEEEKELTLDEQVEKIVKDTLGEKTNMDDYDKIVEIEVTDHMGTIEIEDDKFVSITLVGNQNLSTNMTKKGMWLDSIEVLEEMFKIEEIGKVWIEWQYPLVDKYGNEDLVEVMNIDMTREIADKINWENFPIDNLQEVVDTYYEHPALSKK